MSGCRGLLRSARNIRILVLERTCLGNVLLESMTSLQDCTITRRLKDPMHCTFLFGSKRDEYCRKHGCHWRFLTGADVSTLTRFPHSNACVSWRTTAACDPTGKRESDKDKLCNEVVPSTLSGYCECEGGHQGALSSCEHLPLQCSELCPRQTGPGCVAWRTTA